jgi:membrane protein
VQADGCIDMAAQKSFHFVLAMVPFFIFVAALVSYLPFTHLWGHLVMWVMHYLPRDSQPLVLEIVLGLTRGRTSFLSLGFLAAAWSASSGVTTLMEGLNVAYRVRETRSFWERRMRALVALFALSSVFLTCFGLLNLGHWLGGWVEAQLKSGAPFHIVWDLARWLVSLAILEMSIALIYYLLPNGKRYWHWMSPGACFAVLAWALASVGFDFYIDHLSAYAQTYGALGAFFVLLLWIYMTSLIILVGAEINSNFEKRETARRVGNNR